MKKMFKIAILLTPLMAALAFGCFVIGCNRNFSVPTRSLAFSPTPTATNMYGYTSTPTNTPLPAALTPTFTPGYPQKPWIMYDGAMHFTFGQFQKWISFPGQAADQTVNVNWSDSSQQWLNPATGLYENSMSFDVVNYGTQGWLNIDMTSPSGGAGVAPGGGPMDFSAGNYTQICFSVMGIYSGTTPMVIEFNILNPGMDKCNKFVTFSPTNTWQQVCEPTCFQTQVTQMIFMNISNNNPVKPPFKFYLAHIVAQ